ncbi:unnamed protein product [Schistosoma rodhaini]|uniref:Zinc finger protein n=1 Tax=Schistosoma rodhaini TaxID=6188 RepID=A0A183R8C4_9TREM|nr:unnamed protein product [Schistosoma rodhaini]
MTPYPQGNPDISNGNNNDSTFISNDVDNDYIIHTSSIRLPFIAAGLVNAAVAELLNQLSCRFFEMAIITSKITDSQKNDQENIKNDVQTTYNNSNSSIFPQNERLIHIQDQSKLQKKVQMELDHLSALSPDQMPILQPNNQDIFNSSLHLPHPSTITVSSSSPSISSTICLFTNSSENCNTLSEIMKIKEESEIGYPLELNIERTNTINNNNKKNNDYTIQNSNNFISNSINDQYPYQQNHSSQSNLSRIATVDYLKRHPCNYRGCGKVFFSRTSLIYHKQCHAIDKPYICTYPNCNLTFSNETLLKTHIQLHEPKQLRERYSCTLPGCNKVFVTRECLIEHIRIHTGERPFLCDYPGCTHRFARRCNLFAHKRVHLDKNQRRQYHCIHDGCGKTFLYSRSLTEHMNVHLGERPYVCDYPGCEKSFTSKSYLYAHRRIHLSSIDKSINVTCSSSSSSSSSSNQQFDSSNTSATITNNSNVPPIPVTVTIPVLQPIHYPFPQSILSNKQQLQHHQLQHLHQQQQQQQQSQQRIQSQLQHNLLNNTNINMTNNISAHLFYSNQHN